jgi:hypothetical protein
VDPEALQALTRHAEAIATVRDFAARAGAERVIALVDRGEDHEPAMLECAGDGDIQLTDDGRTWVIPAAAPSPAPPRPLPEVRPAPASSITADPETGELSAPLGAVANLARAVLELARTFGGRSVATADFPTRDPALPITIAAREGEPLLLAVGDGRFVLPDPG